MRKSRSSHLPILLLVLGLASIAGAQSPQMGVLQACTDGQTALKVTQCSAAPPMLCDVELYQNGKPKPAARLPRQTVDELFMLCLGKAAGAAPGAAAGSGTGPDANGFKIGETVRAATAGGFAEAKILRAMGDRYLVRIGSSDVWKQYPQELRRIGPLTDVDRARGLFAMRDRVQVNVEGNWIDGQVVAEMGMEYQVELPNNRSVWASAPNLRFVGLEQKAAVPQPGQPPKPGMTSCAGKIEGRYSSPQVGNFTVVFIGGKAKLRMYGATDDEELECWVSGSKIVLHKPGTNEDMPIEINDDGTLDSPMGELKKKGR